MVWDFHTKPRTIPRYHTRLYSMPAGLRIKPLEAHYFHTDPISLTAKCHKKFTKASENGLCALAFCVFFFPRETEREMDKWCILNEANRALLLSKSK